MKSIHKKLVSVLLICAMTTGGAVVVRQCTAALQEQEDSSAEEPGTSGGTAAGQDSSEALSDELPAADAAYQSAATDLIFWYEDESYRDFFEAAALRYFRKTGIKAAAVCRDTMDYIGEVYDGTMQDTVYPDLYLISGQDLEEAYLYGLVSVNGTDTEGLGIAENAIAASTCAGKLLGYPLSYNVCVFIYQNGYFDSVPESLQSLISYANENEPGENVEYLLEWDVNDPFYDFPFVSNCVSFEKSGTGSMNVVYDEELYAKDMEYFEQILETFSVNAATVSEDEIVDNFLAGRTLCAIVDSDLLYRLEGYSYSLTKIPDLNEELAASTGALTDMIAVNPYSKQEAAAADFARFVTVDFAGELYKMTGHMPVIPSKDIAWTEQVSYEAYGSAVPAPNSRDAKDFWVRLEETISKYF